MAIANWLSQVAAVTSLNLRTLGARRGASAATVLGVAGVVGVFVAVLSIGEGFEKVLTTTGSPETAIVMRAGSDSEMMSALQRADTDLVAQAPGVLRDEHGAVASAELFVVVDLPKASTGTAANVPLRGVSAAALAVRGNIRIVEGRMFEYGRNELLVGVGAAREFAGLSVGSVRRWGTSEWTVVGVFSAGGTMSESEIWCDAGVLQPAYRRGDTFQSAVVRLENAGAFERFKDALTSDPRLDVSVQRETDYYAQQGRVLTMIIRVLGTIITLLMAIGAVFGAVNTMYSAVASRTREIATLRALGFSASPVVLSVLIESLFLAVAGGIVGAAAAYLAFDGYRTSTLNFQTFSQVAFAFSVTPRLLILGVASAMVVGLFGGLLPAVRAARMPITSALREL
jgi:putative ABC transport system permease protein